MHREAKKTFTYDKNRRLTQETKGSAKLDYGYDPNENLTSVLFTAGTASASTEFAYNKLNQLTALSRNGSNRAKFVYDERGNVTSVRRANNSYTSLQYDDANRLNELKNYKNDGTVLNSYKYSYDPNSNQTSIATDKGTILYEYDALNQLIKETLTDGTVISYEYDAVGNRTKKIETKGTAATTTTYTYNAGNELTNVNGQAHTYDQNGNLTNDGDKTYIYNEENQLIEVKDKAGTSLGKFTYDHEGKRTSITTSSGTTNFHYNGDKVIAETDGNNTIISEYTWDTYGNPVTMTKSGKVYYYHFNSRGDVTALTDENGNVVGQYEYDAWGNIIFQTGTMATSNPYRYAGYRFDETTGLYYLKSRYYKSDVGRFINPDNSMVIKALTDEALKAPSEYQNLTLMSNLFAYVANNPVMYVDPSGYVWGNHWWNSKWFISNAINTAITLITLKPVKMTAKWLRDLAAKYKAEDAAIMFAQNLKKKLIAKGVSATIASYIFVAVSGAFTLLMWESDPGSKLFAYADARDRKRNNGYLNY